MLQRFNVFIITLLILIVSVPVQTMAADEITWASATDSGSTGSVTGTLYPQTVSNPFDASQYGVIKISINTWRAAAAGFSGNNGASSATCGGRTAYAVNSDGITVATSNTATGFGESIVDLNLSSISETVTIYCKTSIGGWRVSGGISSSINSFTLCSPIIPKSTNLP